MRLGWRDYFLGIAEAVSKRGDCTRRQVGCVLVDSSSHVVATGYNGVRSGDLGCLDGACPRGKLSHSQLPPDSNYESGPGRCLATHAETNALLHLSGLPQGLTAYVSAKPCPTCEKTLYNAGMNAVYWPGGEIVWTTDEHTS